MKKEDYEKAKNEYDELKNKMKELSKIIKKYKDYDFTKRDENRVTCELCNVSLCKYALENHKKTKKHLAHLYKKENSN